MKEFFGAVFNFSAWSVSICVWVAGSEGDGKVWSPTGHPFPVQIAKKLG